MKNRINCYFRRFKDNYYVTWPLDFVDTWKRFVSSSAIGIDKATQLIQLSCVPRIGGLQHYEVTIDLIR